jgi:hypothetical protein
MIGAYATPAVDFKGRACKRWHRTNQSLENDQNMISDIEDYSNA